MEELWHLVCEIIKQWDVSPTIHIGAEELTQLLEFSLLGVFIEDCEFVFMKYEVLVLFLVIDFDIGEIRVYA
jgi:hypothetical protein